MRPLYLGYFFLFCLFTTPLYVFGFQNVTSVDTNEIIRLNKEAYAARKAVAQQTITLANKALLLAQKTGKNNLIAESYRMLGIGYAYNFEQKEAFDNYLSALSYFQAAKNEMGIARVDNNIDNLYRDSEYDISLSYFLQALPIAQKLKDSTLIAGISLNMGNVYYRKKQYDDALKKFEESRKMYEKQNDQSNLISCYQNSGVAYIAKRDYVKAKELLLKAHDGAVKQLDMKSSIASIDESLADLSIAQNDFSAAEKYIAEGNTYAMEKKTQADFKYIKYQLEFKRKNYQAALLILTDIYKQDSLDYKRNVNDQVKILQAQHHKDDQINEAKLNVAHQQQLKYLFWGTSVATCLLLVLISLLIANVKRKAETNRRLTELNGEVSRQKDNLDRINHHLEEIIDERTKDLQIKNKKLSDYSSYLSHQIRGPIATLKGLMNLEKEGLVDKKECINMMNKCVSEIDDKIINMSDMLHDPDRAGF